MIVEFNAKKRITPEVREKIIADVIKSNEEHKRKWEQINKRTKARGVKFMLEHHPALKIFDFVNLSEYSKNVDLIRIRKLTEKKIVLDYDETHAMNIDIIASLGVNKFKKIKHDFKHILGLNDDKDYIETSKSKVIDKLRQALIDNGVVL